MIVYINPQNSSTQIREIALSRPKVAKPYPNPLNSFREIRSSRLWPRARRGIVSRHKHWMLG